MNLFIRTSIAPYRVDFYNALHERLGMRMCFYHRSAADQQFSQEWLESLCRFRPTYLKGIRLGADSRKLCAGLGRLVRREKPDIVIVPEFQLVLYQLWLIRLFSRKRFRIVSLCDDSIDMIERGNDFSRLHRMLRNLSPRLLDNIIVPHPAVRDWYRERFGIGVWMPIMMDGEKARAKYESLLPRSRELVKKYRLEGRKVILFVGRLVKLKRVDLLIDAFSRMDRDAVLVIVGDGPEMDVLRTRAEACPREVIFTGRLEGDSLYAWYNVADVLALLSSQEAFGAVVNEALVGGARVVVSLHAGASCLVNDENGAVTDTDNPEEIGAVLQEQAARSEAFQGVLRADRMIVGFQEMTEKLFTEITR